MATVCYITPVACVHGKLSKSDSIGFAQRSASRKNYTFRSTKSKKSATAGMLASREVFRQAAAAAKARLQNQSTYAADQLAFSQQKKYTTFFGWLFAEEYKKLS